jgi:hypothetical protein
MTEPDVQCVTTISYHGMCAMQITSRVAIIDDTCAFDIIYIRMDRLYPYCDNQNASCSQPLAVIVLLPWQRRTQPGQVADSNSHCMAGCDCASKAPSMTPAAVPSHTTKEHTKLTNTAARKQRSACQLWPAAYMLAAPRGRSWCIHYYVVRR